MGAGECGVTTTGESSPATCDKSDSCQGGCTDDEANKESTPESVFVECQTCCINSLDQEPGNYKVPHTTH